jgi:hypothetical protein
MTWCRVSQNKKREVSYAENQNNTDGEGCTLLFEVLSALSCHPDSGEIRQEHMAVELPPISAKNLVTLSSTGACRIRHQWGRSMLT